MRKKGQEHQARENLAIQISFKFIMLFCRKRLSLIHTSPRAQFRLPHATNGAQTIRPFQ